MLRVFRCLPICSLGPCFLRKSVSLACLFLAGSALGQELKGIAVMDLQAKAGVEVMVASMLTDVLCTEVKDIGGYKVISRDDIRVMLSHVKDQQLLGCDDTRCLAEIGGALGVPLLIYGNIGKLGDLYMVNLKLIDIENADVVNRISEQYKGDENGLVDLIKHSTRTLFGQPAAPLPTAPVKGAPGLARRRGTVPAAPPVAAVPPVREKSSAGKIVARSFLLSTGIAAGVASYLIYRKGQDLHDNEYAHATTAADEAAYWEDLQRYALQANILLGTSGVLLLGGVITFAF